MSGLQIARFYHGIRTKFNHFQSSESEKEAGEQTNQTNKKNDVSNIKNLSLFQKTTNLEKKPNAGHLLQDNITKYSNINNADEIELPTRGEKIEEKTMEAIHLKTAQAIYDLLCEHIENPKSATLGGTSLEIVNLIKPNKDLKDNIDLILRHVHKLIYANQKQISSKKNSKVSKAFEAVKKSLLIQCGNAVY